MYCFIILYQFSILANKKSGNNDGALIISHFRRLLNPIQVYDVIDCPPEKALVWLKNTQLECIYVLVAGGDGTVAGVLNGIHNLKLKVLIKLLFVASIYYI
jgi:diacylglycerol kinase (ATP)